MSEAFKIVPLSNGRFRAECLQTRDGLTSFQSATFRAAREAREWIEEQREAPKKTRITYAVTVTEAGTYCVDMTRTDRNVSEMLGEFSAIDDANTFVRRMRDLDAAPSHGNER